jgi:hypothetical protein
MKIFVGIGILVGLYAFGGPALRGFLHPIVPAVEHWVGIPSDAPADQSALQDVTSGLQQGLHDAFNAGGGGSPPGQTAAVATRG